MDIVLNCSIFFRSCKILFGLVKFKTAPDRMSGNVWEVFVNTVGQKQTFVDTETHSLSTETHSLSTETDSLGTETDFCDYRNGLGGYRIVIWGVK